MKKRAGGGQNSERNTRMCARQFSYLTRACKEKESRCKTGLDSCEKNFERFVSACKQNSDLQKVHAFVEKGLRYMVCRAFSRVSGDLYIDKLREFQQASEGAGDEKAATVASLKATQVAEASDQIRELKETGEKIEANAGVILAIIGNEDLKQAGKQMRLKAEELRKAASALKALLETTEDASAKAALEAGIRGLEEQAKTNEEAAAQFESNGRNIAEKLACAFGFCG